MGREVVAVRRGAGSLGPLVEAGAVPLPLDLGDADASRRIPPGIEAIVACQSAAADSVEAYRSAYVDANRSLLEAALRLGVRAFVYTGSTGLFGQRDGGVVTEATPAAPSGPTGEVLAEAERLVLAAAPAVPARIVRLSGLYGPGRIGILERVRSGRLALGPGDGAWMNFCHQADAVAFVLAALDRGEPGRVYHGSDAAPARRRDVVEWIAARLGIPPPRAEVAPAAGPDRRVSSEWSRAALGLELRYPSFREGLAGLL
jgi:nucleoside-diphosphate-sugar epimerase